MAKITLAGTYPDEAYELLHAGLSQKFSINHIRDQEELDSTVDLEYLVLRTLKVDKNVINNNSNLKMIQRWGSGYDTVDIEAASRRNIPVAVASGVNSCAVAEHTLLLILAMYRHILPLDSSIRKGVWDRTTYASQSYTINGKTAGLIGCGAIGKLVAEKLRALGAQIQYYDLYRMDKDIEERLGISYVDFETLLITSDIVSIHLPLTPNTANLIATKELALMKKSAVIVNTSRGGIINERDLADFLDSEKILGGALDSYEEEPYPKNGPLLNVKNIIMTPHIGGTVSDLVKPMAKKVLDNIFRVYDNKKLNKREYINFKDCSFPSE